MAKTVVTVHVEVLEPRDCFDIELSLRESEQVLKATDLEGFYLEDALKEFAPWVLEDLEDVKRDSDVTLTFSVSEYGDDDYEGGVIL